MAEDQELRFVCKLCFKKYPCGKSLGGHMRSHVVANSAESDEKLEPFMSKISSFVGDGSEVDGSMNDPRIGELGNGQSSYVLRENPRKSWRAVDSNIPLPLGKICKQCGKGFHSLKALCGHMACHSDKDRGFKDDHSWTSETKLVMDSHSDTEGEDRVIRTRSCKSKKLKKVLVKPPSSSSMSEIDGEEQEEVAICLMMLSRDYGTKGGGGGVYSLVESSDNNSVILETKSSSIDMKRDFGKKLDHQDETLKKVLDVKSKESVFEDGIAEMENSDSGYFLDECVKAESDVSVDGLRRDGGKAKELAKESKLDQSRKRRYMVENSQFYKDYDKMKQTDAQKRSKYECFNCKKSFKSYQALGGHRPCHKKSNALCESRYESGENSLDDTPGFAVRKKLVESTKSSKAKKNKGHVCPFCDRVFKNGQALGGHKRSHFIGGHEVHNNNNNNNNNNNDNNNRSSVTKLDLLDLNLPAPQDEDEDEDDDDGNEQYSW